MSILGVTVLSSCSYTLRGSQRSFFEFYQIKTLYVAPVRNDSYRPGVDIMMYNTIRKRFAQGGYMRIIDDESRADAVLQAIVGGASSSPGAVIRADQLAQADSTTNPKVANPNVQIASNYSVNLSVSFNLIDKDGKTIWTNGVSRSKTFQASTYFGVLGSTSALINDSQFESVLSELAVSVVTDAEESINAFF